VTAVSEALLKCDGERLWASLMRMAKIGATEKGGVCRLTATDLDREARDLFARWCEEAGCTVKIDRLGNMFARRPGRDASRFPIALGSHLDSQPTGGKFDGALGVLAGLEAVRTLNHHNIETAAAIEVVNWTNEEGSRFAPPMTSSGAYAGVFTVDYAESRADTDGRTLGEEMRRIGYAGPEDVGAHRLGAYLELHIEQGPVLEAERKLVGIVTGGQAQRWYEATVVGQEAHAGPTPMDRRRDALVAAARMVEAVNAIGHEFQPGACATVGHLQVHPNSRNVVPGRVFFAVDFRHPDDAVLSEMDTALRERAAAVAAASGVALDLDCIWHCPPTRFDAECIDAVRSAARDLGLPAREMISGAGHDAIYVAKAAPTAMIFVPCRDGISHNEAEYASPEACAAGCDVLLNAALRLAGRD
jgi:beta-ureidopropionase / N-carbamoyl-L-amino-acid hydrolase